MSQIESVTDQFPPFAKPRFLGMAQAVKRWGGQEVDFGGDGILRPETLVDHIVGICQLADEIVNFPSLNQVFKSNDVYLISGVHDLGEIVTTDTPRSDPNYEKLKAARQLQEVEGFDRVVLPQLAYRIPQWGRLRELLGRPSKAAVKMHEAYNRYEKLERIEATANSTDQDALLVRVLERMDAINKGVLYFHRDKKDERKEEAVRQLAGALHASAPALYRIFELLGQDDNIPAMQELARFILQYKAMWDEYDPHVFDTPRQPNTPYTKQLPSFAEVMREIGTRYQIGFEDLTDSSVDALPDRTFPIEDFLHTTKTESLPQRL